MPITEILRGEHRVLRRLLAEVERRRAAVSGEAADAVVGLVAGALLEHARREERSLYAALEEALGARCDLLRVLRNQHRALVAFAAAEEPASEGDVARWLALAADHLAIEEDLLFPLARRCLPEGRLQELAAER